MGGGCSLWPGFPPKCDNRKGLEKGAWVFLHPTSWAGFLRALLSGLPDNCASDHFLTIPAFVPASWILRLSGRAGSAHMCAKCRGLCSILAVQKGLRRKFPSHSSVMCKCLAIGSHEVVAKLGLENCFCWQENTFGIYIHACLLFGRQQKHSGFSPSRISVSQILQRLTVQHSACLLHGARMDNTMRRSSLLQHSFKEE